MKMFTDKIDANVTLIKLIGRMDIQGAEEIDIKFSGTTAVNNGIFIVDLSGVEFLASIGIRSILVTAKAVVARKGQLVLCSPTPLVAGVLEMAGISAIIPVFDNFEDARSAITLS
jgi:anti-anti-sigma factor